MHSSRSRVTGCRLIADGFVSKESISCNVSVPAILSVVSQYRSVVCAMCSPHTSWINQCKWRVQIVKFLIMQFSISLTVHLTPIFSQLTNWLRGAGSSLRSHQFLKSFPTFCGTGRFIIVFTRVLHWFLSRGTSIQWIPSHPISFKIHFNIVHPLTSWSS
jgi:hypothetical protein